MKDNKKNNKIQKKIIKNIIKNNFNIESITYGKIVVSNKHLKLVQNLNILQ